MRIIKRGVIPAEKIVQVTCRVCNSLIEFTQAEMTYYPEQRDGSYYQAKCPVCDNQITVNTGVFTLPPGRIDLRV